MKKTLTILFSALSFASAVYAQSVPSLFTSTDAAALSMGGASAALPADAYAVDNNAAALVKAPGNFDAALSYGMWAPQTANATLAGLGAYYKLNDKLAFGLSGRLFLDKPYDVVGVSGTATGSFTPKDIVVGLGASYAITPDLSAGLVARMVSSSIAPEASGSAFCADIAANYSLGAFDVTLGVNNLGTKISYGKDSYALPAFARLAGSWGAGSFKAGAEVDYLFSGALMAGAGLEYALRDIVFLRGGFHYGDAARTLPTYASAGLGLKFAGIHLDAAYIFASKTLGNTMMFTLGYAF